MKTILNVLNFLKPNPNSTEVPMNRILIVAILAFAAIGFAQPKTANAGDVIDSPCIHPLNSRVAQIIPCLPEEQAKDLKPAPIVQPAEVTKVVSGDITFRQLIEDQKTEVSHADVDVNAVEVNLSLKGGWADPKYTGWAGGTATGQWVRHLNDHNYVLVGGNVGFLPEVGGGDFYLSTKSHNENWVLVNPFVGIRHQTEIFSVTGKIGTAINPINGSWDAPLTIEGDIQYFVIDAIGLRADASVLALGEVDIWNAKASGIFRIPSDRVHLDLYVGPEYTAYNADNAGNLHTLGVQGGVNWSATEDVVLGLSGAYADKVGATLGLSASFYIGGGK